MNIFSGKHKKEDDSPKPSQCYSCAKYNYGCPYDKQPTIMINDGRGFVRGEPCDEYLHLGKDFSNNVIGLTCPKCGSHNITGTYHNRFECHNCGKIS